MKVAAHSFGTSLKFALGALTLATCAATQHAQAQAPYLLPYTVQVLAGGGAATSAGAPCAGLTTLTSGDPSGDGCPVTSASVSVGVGSDIHDVGVDGQGNVYFIDNSSNTVIRRIDARTGIITVYAGSFIIQGQCASAYDKYGDGCVSSDGKANATTGYTGGLGKARGMAVTRNGDVYFADYSSYTIQKISASTGILSVVAGSLASVAKATSNGGVKGYSGDGGPAYTPPSAGFSSGSGAALSSPRGVGVDLAGNVYIADSGNNVIRKVTFATGIITTFAGVNPGGGVAATAGFGGDGGPATSAILNTPEDIQVDPNGNIFIADQGNVRVRVIYQGGALVANLINKTNPGTTAVVGDIYTIIGNLPPPAPGVTLPTPTTTNYGPTLATQVPVGSARKIALDSHGNIFFADNTNNVIWFLDAATGYLRVVAGSLNAAPVPCAAATDKFGDNCPAVGDTLFSSVNAMGVDVDSFGQIYITDTGDKLLRKVFTNQSFPAVAAGASLTQTLEIHFAPGDGPAAANPYTVAGAADFTLGAATCTTNADTTQDCLLPVTYTPTVPGREAARLTFTSTANGATVVGLSGAGTGASVALDPGNASSFIAALGNPQAIAQDSAGNTYIADTGNNRVLRVTAAGASTTFAGTGASGYAGDGAAANLATLAAPKAVAVARNGFVYIADTGNNAIRRVDPVTGFISTYGGGAATVCAFPNDALGDGCLATSAKFAAPAGLAADADGNIFVSDTGNGLIREIAFSGYAYLVAGGATAVCSAGDTFGNGCPPTQTVFNGPTALQVDANRNIFIADTGSNEVREISSATGLVIDLAGTGQAGSSGNGGLASSAQLSGPSGIAVDAAGEVYIADTGNSAVRFVNAAGVINTVVGTLGVPGSGTLPGSALAIGLTSPSAVASNGAGRLVVLDAGNNRAITDDRGSVSYNFGRANLGTTSANLQILETSTGSTTASLPTAPTPSGASTQFNLTPASTNGCAAGTVLAPGANCVLIGQFNPTVLGANTATYTETGTNTINNPAPFIALSGTGATLTNTTSTVAVTSPGTPQYSVPFTVTATIVPASCNPNATPCAPSGTVSFYDEFGIIGAPQNLVQGTTTSTATQSVSGLAVGSHTIYVVYSGDDANYAGSTSSTITVTVAQGTTTTAVTLLPATGPQYATAFSFSAQVKSSTTGIPTGSVNFFAGTTLLNPMPIPVNAQTGIATLNDTPFPTSGLASGQPGYNINYGLLAGTYQITATYTGSTSYARSTSAPSTLTISADAQALVLSPDNTANGVTTIGTAQGSSSVINLTVYPSNTFSGTVSFACSGMPAHSVCTFSPTTLTFSATPGITPSQTTQITLFTDTPPVVASLQSSSPFTFATLAGWPILLGSLFGIFTFRKRLRQTRLLAVLALFALLAGSSAVLSGCGSSGSNTPSLTPVGVYNVVVTATGSNGTAKSFPVTFTVGAGIPGQE